MIESVAIVDESGLAWACWLTEEGATCARCEAVILRIVHMSERATGQHLAFNSDYMSLRVYVSGDEESSVAPEIVKELIALAKAGNREDFDFLAGSAGVEDRDALWTGTRARLEKDAR